MSTAKNKRATRMTADERKQSILRAAAPVIAHGGLHGVSIKEIAVAAGVSEALLYKHFPSKQALYDEALARAREFSQLTISRFATLTPGTESFVLLAYATVEFTLFGFPGRQADEQGAARLVFQSLLSDGAYARTIFADTAANWMDYVVASYRATVAAGDIVDTGVEPGNRFRFVQQLGMALRLSHLPDPPAFDYHGTQRDLANQATLFSLRGVGMTDEAIAKQFQPEKLGKLLATFFPDGPAAKATE
jgi:AcrR family transcriptional regulator